MNRIKYILAAVLVASVFSFTGCSSVTASLKNVFAEKSSVKVFDEAEGIVSQGVIEANEVSINTKIPGKISKIHFEEGAEVKAGDTLVEIGSEELIAKEEQAIALVNAAKASYNAAVGQVSAANSTLQKTENGARAQEIAQAQAAYDLWQKTCDRVQKLYDVGAVPAQKLDEVKTQLEVSKQQLSIAKEGARSEDKSGAQALVAQALGMEQAAKSKLEQAEAGLQEVRAYLKDTKIVSPINGAVTVINSHEGELVSTGMSIATITDLNTTWVEVKVKETDLNNIKAGQQVSVKIPAYSQDVFTGKVVRINQKPDFATKRATNDNGDFDILSFGVKIELQNQEKVFRPGMTAFVQFKK